MGVFMQAGTKGAGIRKCVCREVGGRHTHREGAGMRGHGWHTVSPTPPNPNPVCPAPTTTTQGRWCARGRGRGRSHACVQAVVGAKVMGSRGGRCGTHPGLSHHPSIHPSIHHPSHPRKVSVPNGKEGRQGPPILQWEEEGREGVWEGMCVCMLHGERYVYNNQPTKQPKLKLRGGVVVVKGKAVVVEIYIKVKRARQKAQKRR